MAQWRALGSVTLQDDWQLFPVTSIGSTVFRLRHHTILDPFNSCYLTEIYPNPYPGGYHVPYKRIYANPFDQILTIPFPEGFLEQAIIAREIAVKWRTPYYPAAWTIDLFELIS